MGKTVFCMQNVNFCRIIYVQWHNTEKLPSFFQLLTGKTDVCSNSQKQKGVTAFMLKIKSHQCSNKKCLNTCAAGSRNGGTNMPSWSIQCGPPEHCSVAMCCWTMVIRSCSLAIWKYTKKFFTLRFNATMREYKSFMDKNCVWMYNDPERTQPTAHKPNI